MRARAIVRAGRMGTVGPALFALAWPAFAEEPLPLDLTWKAPVQCPTAAAVHRSIERQFDDLGVESPNQRLAARVSVQRTGSQWRARLRLQGAVTGERTFEAGSCDALGEAVSLVIALALQPDHAASQPPEEETARESPPQPEESEPEPASAAPPTGARPPSFAVGASGLVGSAALPRVAAGAGLDGLVDWRHFQALLSFGYFPPVTTGVAGNSGAEATFDLFFGRAGACYAPAVASLRLGPCLSFEIGRLRGRPRGLAEPHEVTPLWMAGHAGAFASLPAGPLSLRAEASALRPLKRPRFLVDGSRAAHEVPAVGWRASLALFLPL